MIIDSPIVSGSYAGTGSLNQVGNVAISGSLTVTGSIIGDLTGTASFAVSTSYAANTTTSSFAANATSASYAAVATSASYSSTASSADQFNVRTSLTASGLHYPTTDGAFQDQILQTDATGNLSFGDVSTTFDTIYNGEATTLVKGTPVYVSGSNGANPKVYRADASDANKMPVIYIVSENITSGNTGRGITLGHIEGIDLTGYNEGTAVYVAAGGGWTSTRPTGSNTTIQFLGLITKGGSGGKGLVLNPGPATLPNIQTGYAWVGDSNSYPTAISTSSLLVNTASYANTSTSASYAASASNATYAATASSADAFTVRNTLTAQTLVVQTVTSSVVYASGSNIFGNNITNTQILTGSVSVTGSLAVNGSNVILTNQTSSMSASYAVTSTSASYAASASNAFSAVSASYATITSNVLGGTDGYIPIWSGSTQLNSSVINADDNTVTIGGGTTPGFKILDIASSDQSTYITMNSYQNSPYIADRAYAEKYLDGYVMYDKAYFTNPSGSTPVYGITVRPNKPEVYSEYRGAVEMWIPTADTTGSFSVRNWYNLSNSFLVNFLSNGRTLFSDAVDNGINTVQVNGSIYATSLTGSLLGTASYSTNALTASYASNVPATASFAISASQAFSSSYALTASYISGSGGGVGFPFSGSAVITGSLLVTNLGGSDVRYLVTDNAGNITAQAATSSIKQIQTFTASAGQTTFTITNGYTTGLIDVFINGTKLNPSEFTDTSGTSVVLLTGSFANDIVEFNKYLPAAGVTNNALRQITYFTASAGQTVFSASYVPGLIDIFYNGSKLDNSDYTANNGTFFTLATASLAGDKLEVDVYSYQVGAFSGIGGAASATQVAYFDSTNSITGSPNFTISGSTMTVTGSLTVSGSGTFTNIGPAVFSGSITSTAGFTGSFSGTATNATSASYASTATSASYASVATSAPNYVPYLGAAYGIDLNNQSIINTFELTSNNWIRSENSLFIKNGAGARSTGYTAIGSLSDGTGLLVAPNTNYAASLIFQTAANYSYTFPASSGTVALTTSTVSAATSASFATQAQTASYANNLTVAGTLTAQTLVVQTITSSVDYVTGSTRFGSLAANTHVFTGSVYMNTNGLFVSSSGVVGIGYTTPTVALQVSGTIAAGSDTTGWGRFLFDTDTVKIQASKNGTDPINIAFWTQASGGSFSEKVRITSEGRVGIGTTNPKSYSSLTSTGQIIGLNNIGIDYGQSFRLNNYYNSGTATDKTISAGYAASFGLDQVGGGITFGISAATASADGNITATERMRITSGGVIGIGTTNPSLGTGGIGLNIVNSAYTQLRVQSTATSAGIEFKPSTGDIWEIQAGNNNQWFVYNRTDEAYRLVISDSGSVGIGTTTPTAKLQVVGTSDAIISVSSTGTSGRDYRLISTDTGWGEGAGKFFIWDNAAGSRLTITSAGNVGIGRTDPTSLFEISGAGDTTLTIRSTNSSNPRLKFSGGAGVFNRSSSSDTMYFGETADSGNYSFRGGNVYPGVNGTQDLGSSSLRWNTVYTSDLSMSNGIGDYTIVEGEEDLFLYNNKNNKVYKFVIEEVDPSTATPKKS